MTCEQPREALRCGGRTRRARRGRGRGRRNRGQATRSARPGTNGGSVLRWGRYWIVLHPLYRFAVVGVGSPPVWRTACDPPQHRGRRGRVDDAGTIVRTTPRWSSRTKNAVRFRVTRPPCAARSARHGWRGAPSPAGAMISTFEQKPHAGSLPLPYTASSIGAAGSTAIPSHISRRAFDRLERLFPGLAAAAAARHGAFRPTWRPSGPGRAPQTPLGAWRRLGN
jgi:hypothetical protein